MTTHGTRPLDGVTVLDCTQVLAGPSCCLYLADMGADVIKVERFDGDDMRRNGPYYKNGVSAPFTLVNRNKRSISVDLRAEKGKQAFLRLAQRADIIIESFRPGVMTRFGLGYEDVKAVNPGIIYCSISGFGHTGPYADRGGYDMVAQAMSGLMSFTGFPDMPPAKIGVPITDLTAGLMAGIGVLTAYIHRLRTGEGQYVDTSLMEAGVTSLVWEAAVFFATGEVAQPLGSRHRFIAPYQVVKTRDSHMALGSGNQNLWETLCHLMKREELLKDPRFTTGTDRKAHEEELEQTLEKTFVTKTTAEWMDILLGGGVPCGPVNNVEQALNDPQTVARGMVQTMHVEGLGEIRTLGSPVKLSATPAGNRLPPPGLGQHTDEVLAWCGYSSEEIAALRKARVVA